MRPSFVFWTGIRIAGYKLTRRTGWPVPMPINLAISITERCNSRCKTCNVWKNKTKKELTVGEWERIFKSIGKTCAWITVSEGETFISRNLVEIMRLVEENIQPQIITLPTNGILTERIEKYVREILKFHKGMLVVNLSLDGIGNLHDKIRGVKGNFKNLLESVSAIKSLKKEYENLTLGINTVISKYNINQIREICDFVSSEISPDSHIFEIARNSKSLYNTRMNIRPNIKRYLEVIGDVTKNEERSLICFFRKRYYKLVKDMLESENEVIPCYAGISSAHISSTGEVWACPLLCESMGNLREENYDFKKIWKSEKAKRIRKDIKDRQCWCTSANPNYTNILCSLSRLIKG